MMSDFLWTQSQIQQPLLVLLTLMLHRRLLYADMGPGHGMHYPLNEPGLDGKGLITRGSHYILLDKVDTAARSYRPTALEVFLKPQISFSQSRLTAAAFVNRTKTRWSGLATTLPPQIHLLTLEKFRDNGPVTSPAGTVPYLVRLEHYYAVKEDKILSASVTFDIKDLFIGLEFANVTELSLGANMKLKDVHRMDWNTKHDYGRGATATPRPALDGTKVTLKPMQIVTLQMDYRV